MVVQVGGGLKYGGTYRVATDNFTILDTDTHQPAPSPRYGQLHVGHKKITKSQHLHSSLECLLLTVFWWTKQHIHTQGVHTNLRGVLRVSFFHEHLLYPSHVPLASLLGVSAAEAHNSLQAVRLDVLGDLQTAKRTRWGVKAEKGTRSAGWLMPLNHPTTKTRR